MSTEAPDQGKAPDTASAPPAPAPEKQAAPTTSGGPGGPGGGGGGGRGQGGGGRGQGGGGRGQGGGGRGGPGRGGPGRGSRGGDDADKTFEENVVRIYRCTTVVKGGQRFSFAALVVVGDRKGQLGIGYGKANMVPSAVEKAIKAAHKNIVRVKLSGSTLPHEVRGRYGASKVTMVPASEGTGVIAGASVRAVLELAGVHDVLTKSYGSNSPKNLVRATFEGLKSMITREDVERLRGVKLGS